MSGRRFALVVALATAAVAVSGCGASAGKDSAGDFDGQAKGVVTTIDDLQRLGRDRDEEAICSDLLASQLVDAIKRASSESCPTAVEDSLKDVDGFDLEPDGAGAVTVRGTSATARVIAGSGDRERTERLSFVRQGGRWKVSALG